MTYATNEKTVTVVLRNGIRVLGRLYEGHPTAKTFANLTQARRASVNHAGSYVCGTRPYYVAISTGDTQ